jgi:hypothetical protein
MLSAGTWQFFISDETTFSHKNFTSLKNPYNGIDTFAMGELLYWVDEEQLVGLLTQLQVSNTSENPFYWDQYVQSAVGIKLIPSKVSKGNWTLRGLSFSAKAVWRKYYNQPEYSKPYTNDIQIGTSFFYSSLFHKDNKYALTFFTEGGYRRSNFSCRDYSGIVTTTDLKFGPKFTWGDSLIRIYGTATCEYSSHKELYWENSLKTGLGVEWYPFAVPLLGKYGKLSIGLKKRFHVYTEVLKRTNWWGDKPTASLPNTDFRVGVAFSTGGSYRY